MESVATFLRHWARQKVEGGDPRFANVKFVVSDASEPGEGEHKCARARAGGGRAGGGGGGHKACAQTHNNSTQHHQPPNHHQSLD